MDESKLTLAQERMASLRWQAEHAADLAERQRHTKSLHLDTPRYSLGGGSFIVTARGMYHD